jgi:hypothetical protein
LIAQQSSLLEGENNLTLLKKHRNILTAPHSSDLQLMLLDNLQVHFLCLEGFSAVLQMFCAPLQELEELEQSVARRP